MIKLKVPNDWQLVKLNTILKESKIPAKKDDPEKRITVKLHLGGVFKRDVRDIDKESTGATQYFVRKAGQFIYGKQNLHHGAIGIIPGELDGYLSTNDLPAFDVKDGADVRYIYYYFARRYFYESLSILALGTGSERIYPRDFLNIDIPLPPLPEQRKIAEILSTVDRAIEKTDQIIEKYKRIKQGLMQDLLIRGITAFEYEKNKLIQAVKEVYEKGDHNFGREENLVSHLREYLSKYFTGWDVDSEVRKNRQGERPDIIIHKRHTDNNLFAIEVKKKDNLLRIKHDVEKLERIMLDEHHYEDVVFIGFNISNFEEIFSLSDRINFILVSPNGEIKVKSRARKFKDSPLGRIPVEWKVLNLNAVCHDIQDGSHFSPKPKEDGEFMYITSKNIKEGFLDLKEVQYIDKKDHDMIYSRCRVRYGDVLITKDGVNTGNAAINTIRKPFSLLSSVAYLRPNDKVIDTKFLLQYLLSYQGKKTIKDSMKGLAITRITLEILRKIMVKIPPLSEQRRIAEVLSQIDRVIEEEQKYKEKLERLKHGLMEDLLSGKVRVNKLLEGGVEN